jgi:hypothetical protein
MKNSIYLVLGMTTVSLLSGCATSLSLSEKAKLLAATQECGGGDRIPQNPEMTKAYQRCIQLQLDAMAAQEAAYERQQADVVVGLSKAFEPADR